MADGRTGTSPRTVTFTVHGIPQPAGSKRGFRNPKTGGVIITDANSKAKPWKAEVASAAADAMQDATLLDGPLHLSLEFTVTRPKSHFGAKGVRQSAPEWPTVKPDVLKLARAVEDALTGIVYRDDSQIVAESLQKRYGEPARVDVTVSSLATCENCCTGNGCDCYIEAVA